MSLLPRDGIGMLELVNWLDTNVQNGENNESCSDTAEVGREKPSGSPSLQPLSRAFIFLTPFPLSKDFLQLRRDTVI